jgi:hypothetical protein
VTVAICTNCGASKLGALTACQQCGFDPETPEDKAKALMLSDHNMTPEQLELMSQKIRAGEPPQFDEADCTSLAEQIRQDPELMRMPLGCVVIPWVLIALALLLGMAVVLLYFFPKLISP